jgi:hypothetical protein
VDDQRRTHESPPNSASFLEETSPDVKQKPRPPRFLRMVLAMSTLDTHPRDFVELHFLAQKGPVDLVHQEVPALAQRNLASSPWWG